MSEKQAGALVGLLALAGLGATIFGLQGGLCDNFGAFCPAGHLERVQEVAKASETSRALLDTAADEAWRTAENLNTPTAYESYLSDYPNGARAITARNRLAEFRSNEEKLAWRQALSIGSIEGYEEYLRLFPTGANAFAARDAIELQKTHQAESDWRLVEAAPTATSYQNFLSKHPESPYAARAKEALRRLEEDARTARTIEVQQQCQAWALAQVPKRAHSTSGGAAACIAAFIGNTQDCGRRAQQAFEEGQRQQRYDAERRDQLFNQCVRQGGSPG